MICPKCGNAVPEEKKFCAFCGFDFMADEKTKKHPVREYAMQLMGGPVFIIACVCTIISFCLTAVSWFMPSSVDMFLSMFGLDNVLGSLSEFLVLFSIIANTPLILKVLGVIILLCKVRSKEKKGGFVLVKIGLIFDLVIFAIIATIICIYLTIAIFAGTQLFKGDEAVMLLIISVVTVVAVLFFSFKYFKDLIGTVNVAKAAVLNDSCSENPSLYVAVINFIVIFFGFVGMLMTYSAASALGGDIVTDIVLYNMLPSILDLTALLLFSILIIRGRRLYSIHLNAIREERTVSVTKPVYAPATSSLQGTMINQSAPAAYTPPAYTPPAAPYTPSASSNNARNTDSPAPFLKPGGDL